jgi:hypothetical protein
MCSFTKDVNEGYLKVAGSGRHWLKEEALANPPSIT